MICYGYMIIFYLSLEKPILHRHAIVNIFLGMPAEYLPFFVDKILQIRVCFGETFLRACRKNL